ncbi:carotenoid oxygenase family protein [Variovorax sp. J2P1-59]|uniref:carotenoid oxygenase family protein n=1 Tax=Variovorax flavidus TaxID=3053501 RepID=UPI0025753739|nr:carotenoid oxygenase family protein [Variovorax sp. J2P1-59]MDM0078914.1 carotenoid oxygenase family protein [Variovorax sp. J2P1-59]
MTQETPPRRVNGAPITFEAEAAFLPVVGELPAGLEGTLYRNGPNPQFPSADAHLFGGDGMLHAFELANGRASYLNRWVRTAHWKAEREAGRRLFDGFGRPKEGDAAAAEVADEGVANTHVAWHAGRLLALEEAHLPIEIDPVTLATRGPFDFGGGLSGPFTAHPKTDPVTGEMLFFGYGATGPLSSGMTYGAIDTAGRVTRFDRFEAPYASMVHDFAVTERHVLFPVLPLSASMARAQRGLPPFAWEPELGARVGVMPRDGRVEDIRWFEGEAGYVFHVMNAWEEQDARGGQRIVADVMRYDEPPLFPYPDGRPTDPQRSVARLCRWTFDLTASSDRFEQQPLDDLSGEFPRIDERRAGLPYRHGWYACQREARYGAGNEGLAHYDAVTRQRTLHYLPPGDRVSEPVFVPRAPNAQEGEGWLLATVYRAAECRSDLAVFNALALADGPIATVQLSHRVPSGFHGSWLPARR